MTDQMKCNVCLKMKSTDVFETKRSGSKYKSCPPCRIKQAAARRLRKQTHGAQDRAYNKKYNTDNQAERSLQKKSYQIANRDHLKQKNDEWRTVNKEVIAVKARAYALANKDNLQAYRRRWDIDNIAINRKKASISGNLIHDRNRGFIVNDPIDMEYLEGLMDSQAMKCIYCSIGLSLDCAKHSNHMMTIERKDNLKGHEKSNCVLACLNCNFTRANHMTFDAFAELNLV